MEARNGTQHIKAYVPLSEMSGYATDLRSKNARPWYVYFDLYDIPIIAEEVPKKMVLRGRTPFSTKEKTVKSSVDFKRILNRITGRFRFHPRRIII